MELTTAMVEDSLETQMQGSLVEEILIKDQMHLIRPKEKVRLMKMNLRDLVRSASGRITLLLTAGTGSRRIMYQIKCQIEEVLM